jgi:hypothetical protein
MITTDLTFQILDFNITLTPLHMGLFTLNIIFFFLAAPIVKRLNFDPNNYQSKLWMFRFFNVIFLLLHIADLILLDLHPQYGKQLSKMAFCLISVYTVTILHHVSSHFVLLKFGSNKLIDNQHVNIQSYSSRVVQLLTTLFFAFINLIIIIQILGYKSLLETTGLVGIVIGFFALTSSIWAPDVFHGLALLNSNMFSDGDIIEVDGEAYIIYKTSLLETVLLNIKNNHRTRIRNAQLASKKIDNLTKLADAQGNRETIIYKVGYPQFNDKTKLEELERFKDRVKSMFDNAYNECVEESGIEINPNSKPEYFLVETGDFALSYSYSFYVNRIKKTKISREARAFLRTKYQVNEKVYKHSVIEGLNLSTPILLENQ